MSKRAETDLYPPIKSYWETRGYTVKSEIASADVVAIKVGQDAIVTELKLGFSLALLHQAIARQSAAAQVYVAVPKWSGRAGWRAFKANLGLCRRLELGVLVVDFADGSVREYAEPKPFQRRKNTKRAKRLHSEFDRRIGDPNLGGAQAGQVMTSHRQRAMICAAHLLAWGACKGSEVAKHTRINDATRIMHANQQGWFLRVARGVFDLTPLGQDAAKQTEHAGLFPIVPIEILD
jgi:hypothetical protein